jgi:hypothetical protein
VRVEFGQLAAALESKGWGQAGTLGLPEPHWAGKAGTWVHCVPTAF